MTQPLLQAADLRGMADLTADVVAGLAGLVEAMRARSAPGPGRESERDPKALIGWLAQVLAPAGPHQPLHPEREAIRSALNGVLGDHLATTGSPLAIAMAFRRAGQMLPIDRHLLRTRLGRVTPKLLVLVHGLGMNDLQWQHAGHDHGEALAEALGYTPVYLHYNSGLSVSTNGRVLAPMMERLYDTWPAPVERLVMLGHGMGGLVARSAIHHGALMQRGGLRWPGRVNDLVCLGVPHQGAPAERVGYGAAPSLGVAPYAAPLLRLARARSAGINDLQLGNILRGAVGDDGAYGCDRVGLPDGARCFAIAASTGGRLPGDGVVSVASALGEHDDPGRRLGFAPEHRAVVHGVGHAGLLSSLEAYGLMRQWLG